MPRETKIIIAIAIVGMALFALSIGSHSIVKTTWDFMISTIQYLFANAGKIISSPVCYGSFGLVLMLFAYKYFEHSQRQQKDFEKITVNTKSKIIPRKAIYVPKRPADRQQWHDAWNYVILPLKLTKGRKDILEELGQRDYPNDKRTYRRICAAGEEGLLD